MYGCTSPREPIVRHTKCFEGMGRRTPSGTLIALGKSARTIFAFLVLCMVDGRRERGARMELTLRIGVDREFDVGDEEREDGREREEVAVAGAVLAMVLTLSALVARGGVRALGDSTSGGDSEIGEDTNVTSRRRSRASSMKRFACSSAASHFFAELKWIWRSRRPCTSITIVCSFENLQRSCPLIPLTRAIGIR